MTWTNPNLYTDNQIITANYWNTLLGDNGSLAYVENKYDARISCNVYSAIFNPSIATQTSTASNTTRITLFDSVTDSTVFNSLTGKITLPEFTPVLFFWKITSSESTFANYAYRSTIEVDSDIDNDVITTGFITSTKLFTYLYKREAENIHMIGSGGFITKYNTDAYYLTLNHSYHSTINFSGTITIITQPSMV